LALITSSPLQISARDNAQAALAATDARALAGRWAQILAQIIVLIARC
jgi:hypothetical protein